MRASILSLASFRMRRDGAPVPHRNWDQQELAELYRVRDRLVQSGLHVALDVGLTDEGEPWAVFLQSDSGDVFVHIARLNGAIIVANLMANVVYRGDDFRSITDQMLRDAPLVVPPGKTNSAKVVMHPRSVFTAFVAAAVVLAEFVRSIEPVKAATDQEKASHDKAVAETKTLFPQIFDRVLARDSGWMAPIATQSAAASLMAAAVGAVLMIEDYKDDVPSVAQLVPEASSTDAGAQAQTADSAMARAERAEADDLANDQQAQSAASHADPKFAAVAPQGHAEEDHSATIDAPVVTDTKPTAEQTARAIQPAAEPAGPSYTARIAAAVAPEPVAAEAQPATGPAAAAQTQDAKGGKEMALILDSILTVRLPDGLNDRSITLAIDRAIESGTLASDKPSGPLVAGASTDNTGGSSLPGNWILHANVTDMSSATMRDGSHDVVLLTGQDMTIYNFRFNEDYLLVDGEINATTWIKSIEVQGDDVVILATNGSVISLIDSHGLVA